MEPTVQMIATPARSRAVIGCWRSRAVIGCWRSLPVAAMVGLAPTLIGGASLAQTNACPTFLRTNPTILHTVDGYAAEIARLRDMNSESAVAYISGSIVENARRSVSSATFNQYASHYYNCLGKIDRDTIAKSWPKLNAVLAEKEKGEAIQLEAQRRAEAAQQQKERQAQAAHEEQARRQAEINAQPANRLQRAYRLYIAVRECFDARDGYAVVYLNERQMVEAKTQVRAIEKTLKAADPSIDPNAIWTQANQPETSKSTNNIGAILLMADMLGKKWVRSPEWVEESESYCHRSYSALSSFYGSIVPESKLLKKDF